MKRPGEEDNRRKTATARSHTRIRVLHRLDVAEEAAVDVDAIVDAIDHTQGEHLLVLAGKDRVEVVPYE